MDRMDRMLGNLPEENGSSDLASRIRLLVHRRHRRGQLVRRGAASLLGLSGLWLLWPGIVWLLSGDFFASGTPWLEGSLDSLNYESLELLNRFWNGTFSAQNAIGSALALSIWIGAVLVCCAIFLVIDSRAWEPAPGPRSHGGSSAVFPASVHI